MKIFSLFERKSDDYMNDLVNRISEVNIDNKDKKITFKFDGDSMFTFFNYNFDKNTEEKKKQYLARRLILGDVKKI